MNTNRPFLFSSLFLALLWASPDLLAQKSKVDDLVAKIIKAEEANDQLSSQYIYEETITIDKLDKKGNVRKSRTTKFLVISNPGITYQLKSIDDTGEQILVAGRPLNPTSTSIATKGSSSPSTQQGPKQQRIKNAPLQYSESLQMSELVKRYDFTYAGEQTIKNSVCHVLSFTPSKKLKAKSRVQKVLNNLTGKLWIDKKDHIIKACEAELDKSLSLAWPFATLRELKISYLGTRLPSGVWMPEELSLETSSRIFVGRSYQKQTARMSGYRKLSPEELKALKP